LGTGVCVQDEFRAVVTGLFIRRVVFLLDGRGIGTRTGRPPFSVLVRGLAGIHTLRARVTFRDGTRARTLNFRYRACAEQTQVPRPEPGFTG
jgi:hypothetical protein